jgi:hypothetical protein
MLRRIFGLKRKEITGGYIKLHNEELHNWYHHHLPSRFRPTACSGSEV